MYIGGAIGADGSSFTDAEAAAGYFRRQYAHKLR
jgi:hypothetical protein